MRDWYAMLEKPFFAPPAEVFGPVWTFLYILIAYSFGYVLYQIIRGHIPARAGLPFFLNLALNLSFTPVTFGLQNLVLGSFIVIGVLLTIVWMIAAVWPYSRLVAYAQVPYLLWTAFAAILQLSITFLN